MDEGQKFNGTNIWLSNLLNVDESMVIFAHNQQDQASLTVLDDDKFYSFGNGDVGDEWEKQKLIKYLVQHAFDVFEHVTETNDINLLKNLLFKIAECKKSQYEPSKWAHIDSYRMHEKFEHSSIFVQKHLLHSGDHQYEDWYGTVSTTLIL